MPLSVAENQNRPITTNANCQFASGCCVVIIIIIITITIVIVLLLLFYCYIDIIDNYDCCEISIDCCYYYYYHHYSCYN